MRYQFNDLQVVDVIQHPDLTVEGWDDSDQAVSKEEEERYRKLLQENEQLQQLISAREVKLKLLNQRLLERDSSVVFSSSSLPSANGSANTNSVEVAKVVTTVYAPQTKKNRYG